MKDIVKVVDRGSIHDYCMALWRTSEFRESHGSAGGYVRRWVDRFAEYPRLFHTLTDARLEKPHFSPWWNSIGHRRYENAAINDLFYLHEIAHVCMLVYDDTMSWASWAAKMADNEMLASLESETLAYFALPTLRDKAFPGNIWADRFLDGPSDGAIHASHRSFMLMERYRSRLQPDDALERRIAGYQSENDAWAETWKSSFRDVERTMCQFRRMAVSDRSGAADWLVDELAKFRTGRRGSAAMPWPDEAEAFARVYWRTRDPENLIATPTPTGFQPG